MFDLEKSISEWWQQMLAVGIKTPVPLEELEIHLRDEIERQAKSGLSEQLAFETSVQRIGQPKMLKNEFNKNERNIMKRWIIISAGLTGVLIGQAIVMPAVALYLKQGAMVHDAAVGLLIGIPIALVGIGTAIFGFKKRKA